MAELRVISAVAGEWGRPTQEGSCHDSSEQLTKGVVKVVDHESSKLRTHRLTNFDTLV